MGIQFGREICGNLQTAESREWLITNSIGGYASGTVAGLLTRCYHGLLVAALKPPLGRTLLLSQFVETIHYNGRSHLLSTHRWADGSVSPAGYQQIEQFSLKGTTPVWQFAFSDARLEKRIWMQPGFNTTYVRYQLNRATEPLTITLQALVNYRDYHGSTSGNGWQMGVSPVSQGVEITAYPGATPLYLLSCEALVAPAHEWYYGFDLAAERSRGLSDREDHLHAATFTAILNPGESITVVASTEQQPDLQSEKAFELIKDHEQKLIQQFESSRSNQNGGSPDWIKQLVLAADQFVVNRSANTAFVPSNSAAGKTIIAGYHWFGDWGRDTMISLPGLTLSTGRPEVARLILRTFARYIDQGMLPNVFPDASSDDEKPPEYNTVDANLWYFEAIRQYYAATQDKALLAELFPVLSEMIDWHCRGTRYNIHRDPDDGLLYAGEVGVQLTWMDAKIGDWVVTPRIGKPIEVNALWYSALRTMAAFSQQLGKPAQHYATLAQIAESNFSRFWNDSVGYCYDVIDGPDGDDDSLRPNQIFAVSLAESPLTTAQQKSVVDACGRSLLTSYGLRSLCSDHPRYSGCYGGDAYSRDSVYHQGTVWGWLLGPFALAHLRVYRQPEQARQFLAPMANHMTATGLGNLSEVFDGDAPFNPGGCIAQAWSVAEVLRAWQVIAEEARLSAQ